MPMYQRPAFWRVPHQRPDPDDEVRNSRRQFVTPGTPAGRELTRGDIIAKIDHYDARDLRHEDAQNLFKNAPNQIKLVVQRTASPCPTTQWRGPESLPRSTPVPPQAQYAPQQAQYAPHQTQYAPHQTQYAPQQTQYAPQQTQYAPQQAQFVPQQEGEYRTLMLSSAASNRTDETVDESIQSQGTTGDAVRDRSFHDTSAPPSATMAVNPNFFPNGYQDPKHPEEEITTNWPYRTTPLVLPGAKVRREPGPTESYLRHHPNPAMRAPPHHDLRDTLMRQKVAESVLQRVVGEESNKVVHKQFNSPINLYSEQNIANSIRQQTSPLPPTGPASPAGAPAAPAPAQPAAPVQLFEPLGKRPASIPKPVKRPDAKGKQTTFVSSLQEEHIQQSNSFKRLMYHVLGDTQA